MRLTAIEITVDKERGGLPAKEIADLLWSFLLLCAGLFSYAAAASGILAEPFFVVAAFDAFAFGGRFGITHRTTVPHS